MSYPLLVQHSTGRTTLPILTFKKLFFIFLWVYLIFSRDLWSAGLPPVRLHVAHALESGTLGSYSFGVLLGNVVRFGRSQLRSEAYHVQLRTRPVLESYASHSMRLPKPCLTTVISEHRYPFDEPEHPSVTGNAPPQHVHAPTRHGDCPEPAAFPYRDGQQHVCTSLDCLQPPAG